MKKFVFFLMAHVLLFAGVCSADDNAPAIVVGNDGQSVRVFLMGMKGTQVSTEFQRLRQKKTFEKSAIKNLKFTHKKFDMNALEASFDEADYAEVIRVMGPVVRPFVDYMTVNNNLEEAYGVLLKACCRNGDFAIAKVLASKVRGNENPELKLQALACGAVAAAGLGEIEYASNLLGQIEDPAAVLYVKAVIARAEGKHRDAMKSAVEVIAEYANEMDWMPSSELLCAELYLDMGKTNSALVTARQTQKLYTGTNIEKEAEALQLRIKQSTAEAE
jgi:hypothetical protein